MTRKLKIVISVFACFFIAITACLGTMLYITHEESKQVTSNFENYKIEATAALQKEQQINIEYEKLSNFPNLEYDYGDLRYGSCGVALSETYTDLVVQWREDPVYIPAEKTAFLTFDDGPSERTKEILEILDEYGVKATFFVIGTKNADYKELYKEIVDRGHTLGLHSYTHQYDKIYSSLDGFLSDFDDIYADVQEYADYSPTIFRFPGGSNNGYAKRYKTFDSIKEEMDSRGFVYYDWNVSSEDARYSYISAEDIINNVITGASTKNYAIILMHDSAGKHTTVEALPGIIEGLREQGFELETLDSSYKAIQYK